MTDQTWFLVGFPEYFGKPTHTQIWSIYGTLEAVASAIDEVNILRCREGWNRIIGRLMTEASALACGMSWPAELNPQHPPSAIRHRFFDYSLPDGD